MSKIDEPCEVCGVVEWQLGRNYENERIVKLLEIGGPIEQIICDYWGDPEFDKDDALMLIEKAIKGEK